MVVSYSYAPGLSKSPSKRGFKDGSSMNNFSVS